jgi:starch phosphorylase
MTLVPVFNTNRMVEEYLQKCYLPSHRRFVALTANNQKAASDLAAWRKRVAQGWGQVHIEGIESPTGEALRVGGELPVKVHVKLGGLSPDEVDVQLCHGLLDSLGELANPQAVSLAPAGQNGSDATVFAGTVPCKSSGQFGFAVRVLPKHPNLSNPFEPGLVTWG